MTEKSKSMALFEFLCSEYIATGYMYSASWPYNSLLDKGFSQEVIPAMLSKV